MVARKILAALLAVAVLTAGVGAVTAGSPPDGVPAEEPDDETPDDADDARENADDDDDAGENETETDGEQTAADAREGAGADDNQTERRGPPEDVGVGQAGPPVDMPDPVPDFVVEIHSTIGDYLEGGLDSLGDAVSSITPGDDGESEAPEDGQPVEGNESADGNATDGQAVGVPA